MTFSNPSRYSRGYGRGGEPLPFSTTLVPRDLSDDSSHEVSIRDGLAYGEGEDVHPSVSARSLHSSYDHAPDRVFHVSRSMDGEVEVLQKVHVAS